MDISELQGKKINLEKTIARMLEQFEKDCSVQIKSVTINSLPEKNMFLDSKHVVYVEVLL